MKSIKNRLAHLALVTVIPALFAQAGYAQLSGAKDLQSYRFCIRNSAAAEGHYLGDVPDAAKLHPRCSIGEIWKLMAVDGDFCLLNSYTGKYLSDYITELWPRCSTGEKWRLEKQTNGNFCLRNSYLDKYLAYQESTSGEQAGLYSSDICDTRAQWALSLKDQGKFISELSVESIQSSLVAITDKIPSLITKLEESVRSEDIDRAAIESRVSEIASLAQEAFDTTGRARSSIVEWNQQYEHIAQYLSEDYSENIARKYVSLGQKYRDVILLTENLNDLFSYEIYQVTEEIDELNEELQQLRQVLLN